MNRTISLLFWSLLTAGTLHAQFQSAPIFTSGDQISLELNADGTYFHLHEVKKGHTMYALAKTFGYSLEQLMKANRKTTPEVSLGELIKVPIPASKITSSTTLQAADGDIYIPVVYKVKPKENLYRIAKVYFQQPMADIMSRNSMATTTLDKGQTLLLGWYLLNDRKAANTPLRPAATPVTQTTTTTVTTTSTGEVTTSSTTMSRPTKVEVNTSIIDGGIEEITNESIDSLLEETIRTDVNMMLLGQAKYREDMTLIEEKMVAQWNRNITDNGELYVLHNTAEVDTYMELYNDLVKRSVRAKIIGKIPFGAYTSDVKLIISPKAAEALGALNERFRVSIKYYKMVR